MVLADEDRGRHAAVWVDGVGWSQDAPSLESRYWGEAVAARRAGEMAYRQAEIEPGDVDLAEVDDTFAYKQLQHLDALGLDGLDPVAREPVGRRARRGPPARGERPRARPRLRRAAARRRRPGRRRAVVARRPELVGGGGRAAGSRLDGGPGRPRLLLRERHGPRRRVLSRRAGAGADPPLRRGVVAARRRIRPGGAARSRRRTRPTRRDARVHRRRPRRHEGEARRARRGRRARGRGDGLGPRFVEFNDPDGNVLALFEYEEHA